MTKMSIVYGIGDLLNLKQKVLGQHPIMYGRWEARHDSNLHNWGRRLPFLGAVDVRLTHQLPGKSIERSGDKHIGRYPIIKRIWIVIWVRQGLVKQGITESKRTAILCDLTIMEFLLVLGIFKVECNLSPLLSGNPCSSPSWIKSPLSSLTSHE